MTLKQLLEILSKYDENLEVVYPCQDGGLYSILEVSEGAIELNVRERNYMGEHEFASDNPKRPTARAIILI